MKKIILICAALFAAFSMDAQFVYTSADQFPVFGKITDKTSERYTRLTPEMEKTIRKPIWDLGQDSAGLTVRFRTNSTGIGVKWTTIYNTSMNHMTVTGIRGLDLYVLENGRWWFVKSAIPGSKKENEKTFISGMTAEPREFMIHLSLYDGVRDLQIGIDSTAVIEQPQVDFPVAEKPVIMYGTSILQGGCATRPGMASTNIIQRRLGREVINLGFSGSAQLDKEIAEYMASAEDPGVYVMDNLPNCKAALVAEKTEPFVKILRDAHPDVPIIFVENPYYVYAHYSKKDYDNMKAANDSLKVVYGKLKKEGWKKIYYVKGDALNGTDREGTIDGAHFTDLGMIKYADILTPVIKKALK